MQQWIFSESPRREMRFRVNASCLNTFRLTKSFRITWRSVHPPMLIMTFITDPLHLYCDLSCMIVALFRVPLSFRYVAPHIPEWIRIHQCKTTPTTLFSSPTSSGYIYMVSWCQRIARHCHYVHKCFSDRAYFELLGLIPFILLPTETVFSVV